MGSPKHSMLRTGNRIGAWLYRVSDGRLSSGSTRVLMITTPGRRTGTPRSTCVRYFQNADGFVVWGTGSGSKRDPDWFRNLRAAAVADVQVGAGGCSAGLGSWWVLNGTPYGVTWFLPELRKSVRTPGRQAGPSRWRFSCHSRSDSARADQLDLDRKCF